ncbi:MAG: phosphate acyltransferase PlsX [Acidobacteriota bacterium]|nr:phosphate acyltransferase PlsX [Acidobacteriota bacterium]
MGGDFAPRTVVDGAVLAARRLDVGVTLVGDARALEQELARHLDSAALDLTVVDAAECVGMSEAPMQALRRKPRASVKVAAELVAAGEAAALFSAGHTGATVMASHAAFGMLPGIDRPALAATLPARGAAVTLSGKSRAVVLLDSGANVECRPQHLVQFAMMGAAFARTALDVADPRVALLSIGEEAGKGNELTREAHRLLQTAAVTFVGNIEAGELYSGSADVVVCDGFTGNIALKVSEGLVETVEAMLREELSQTLGTRLGWLLSRRAFRNFRRRVDYAEYGGAPLLGVAGITVVGHGRSSAKAVRSAILMSARLAGAGFIDKLKMEASARQAS